MQSIFQNISKYIMYFFYKKKIVTSLTETKLVMQSWITSEFLTYPIV